METLLACKLQGVEIEEGATFYEQACSKIMLENLRPSWLVFSPGFSVPPHLCFLKRLADILLSVLGLICAAPLMLVVALLIKIDSRGPVFYRQKRVGQNGKPFILSKFRSMRNDAEASTGPIFADKDDLRITRVGRVLRTTRVDELPQLLNILRGEMSFVGPRPERPFFVEQFAKEIPYYTQRLSVKPGLTGWAQVCYSYGATARRCCGKTSVRFVLYKKYVSHPGPVHPYEDAEDHGAWQRGSVMWSGRQLTLTDYWLLVWRYKWLLMLPFVTLCIGTVLYNRTLPDIYRASSSVLVEAPKVPESYVQSTVPARVQDRLRTITQQITSRSRLEAGCQGTATDQ